MLVWKLWWLRRNLKVELLSPFSGWVEALVARCDFGWMTKRAAEAETLEAKVEQVVREHLAAHPGAVKAALERAFGVPVKPLLQAHTREPTAFVHLALALQS